VSQNLQVSEAGGIKNVLEGLDGQGSTKRYRGVLVNEAYSQSWMQC
jgi:hypothetical protein